MIIFHRCQGIYKNFYRFFTLTELKLRQILYVTGNRIKKMCDLQELISLLIELKNRNNDKKRKKMYICTVVNALSCMLEHVINWKHTHLFKANCKVNSSKRISRGGKRENKILSCAYYGGRCNMRPFIVAFYGRACAQITGGQR